MDIQIDISNVIITTERLILRAWKETDLEDFYEYASVEGVGEMAGWNHHKSIDESRNILNSFIEGKNVFALEFKENNKVIGSLGLHPSWANEEPDFTDLKVKEIGYVLSKAYWGKGIMAEAVSATIHYCFDQLGLDAISIGHFSINNQSKRVIEKCGFKFVKDSTYYAKHLDKTFDDSKYILLKEDFLHNTK